MKAVRLSLICLALVVGLTACETSTAVDRVLSPFRKKEKILPGERVDVITETNPIEVSQEAGAQGVALPQAISNGDWSQPGGTASNNPGHLAFSGTGQRAWISNAGRGSSDDSRISAAPVIAGGRVFVMDAEGAVSAFSSQGGGRIWRTSLTPEDEDDDGVIGGGVASDGGLVFAASGFGFVTALDPSSGQRIWTADLGIPVRSAPTAFGGRVYVVTSDNRVFALSSADGSQIWSYRGISETTRLLSSASPAVSNEYVVVPYSSGEIIAFKTSDGQPIWADSLTRTRSFTSVSGLSEVAARPVISGGIVYAVGVSGRLVAVKASTGERLWTHNLSSTQTPYLIGNTLYVVGLDRRLIAFDSASGKVRWISKLPGESRDSWAGPVGAGGRLWLSSSKGALITVDPSNGQVTSERAIGDETYLAPIVAGGQIFVLTDKANLVAFN